MASKYEFVTTAKALFDKIRIDGGRSTMQEDTDCILDILKKATDYELAAFANDNAYQDIVYDTLFDVWGWREAAKFWEIYTSESHNNLTGKVIVAEGERQKAVRDLEAATRVAETAKNNARTLNSRVAELEADKIELGRMNYELEQEILRLKAKLYDMMVAGAV